MEGTQPKNCNFFKEGVNFAILAEQKIELMLWEDSPVVAITINVAPGWFFEDGYAKEAARYFQTAGNSFRTMRKKLPVVAC